MQADAGMIERVYRLADAVVVEVAKESTLKQVEEFVSTQLRWLARIAKEGERPRTIVRHPGGRIKDRRIPVSMAEPSEFETIITPAFHSIDLPQTPALYRALERIFLNPGEKYFLTRVSRDLSRQVQIAATESTQSLIIGATPKQVIGRQRSDFWLAADLDEFNRDVRQQLSIGSSMDYSFKGKSPVTNSNWRRFKSRVSCIEVLSDGSMIQMGTTYEATPIAVPV